MKDILGMVSLTTAASVLLILSAVWLIVLIIKKENEFIFRAMMLMLLLLLGLIFLRQHEAGKWTWPDIRSRIFGGKTPEYNYFVDRIDESNRKIVQYVFQEPKPKLIFSLDKTGKYFHITDVKPLNDVLKSLGLPKVKDGVPELASITGSRLDINQYRWGNYSEGILTIERTLCQNKDTLEVYHCLTNIHILYK
jgi:hypothetical protein